MSEATTVRARMKCTSVQHFEHNSNVELQAFHSTDPKDPNKSYSDATPCAKVNMTITNKAAIGAFEPGRFYLIDFVPEADVAPKA